MASKNRPPKGNAKMKKIHARQNPIKLLPEILHYGRDNPYRGLEDNFQASVMTELKLRYPKLLIYHVPNGGSRGGLEATIFMEMGVLSGVSDIIIEDEYGQYGGARIELKVKQRSGKMGKLFNSQIEYLNKAWKTGKYCAVGWNSEAVLNRVEWYVGLGKRKII